MAAKKAKRKTKAAAKRRAPKTGKAARARAQANTKRAKPAKGRTRRFAKRTFKSLAQVRAAIDAMDRKIVPLLCERLYFVTQAAQFKPSVEGVIVQSRVEEVVDNARRIAQAWGGNPMTIETVYRTIIDSFTAEEQDRWRSLHVRL